MIKYIFLAFLGLLSFSAALAASLAITGNLSKNTLDILMGKEPAIVEEETSGPDLLGPLAQQLNDREKALVQKEQQLDERERLLDARQRELQSVQEQLEEMRVQIIQAMDAKDKAGQERLQSLAKGIAEMKSAEAARALESLSEDEAAEILSLMDPKKAGEIYDDIDPIVVGRIWQRMKQLQE